MLVCHLLNLSLVEIIYNVRSYIANRLPTIFKVSYPSDQVLLLTIQFELGMEVDLNWMLLVHMV